MFKLRYFPNAWKTAVIIPILKRGKNPKLADSHRPISLLPILSKLAEKIISTKLNDFLERENILTPEHHGFRPRLSTSHQLLRLVEYIKDRIDRNQYTAAVFLDIQKAFDREIRVRRDYVLQKSPQRRRSESGTIEQRCLKEATISKEKMIYTCRMEYLSALLEVENESPGLEPEKNTALKDELMMAKSKIKFLEGKMTEFLPRPIALSPQNIKIKVVKRPVDPVTKPAKTTTKVNKIKNQSDKDFVFPKKTVTFTPAVEKEQVKTKNTFEALNSSKTDAEDVTPAYKIKPIYMRIINSYNLILQDLHRKYPTATNTHTRGFIKIEAQFENDHNDITTYLKDKNLEFYFIELPSTRPLKLVIKGLPDNIDPEDIKNDLISKGIKIVKISQVKRFPTTPPPSLST
ncbi:probable RNA-directed DNA polymerase from transposon X-element [Trichonephila clavipes]|nr:probable RNA-directed DNA polymerase from transposon X-element [Trichonephila clavipes]